MDAREVALLTLSACQRQGAWSDGLLKKNIRAANLDSRDAALATRLCFGVLQNQLLCDFYIEHFSSVKPRRMEEKVLLALRLGVYQILFLTKVPRSAAVNQSVELVRKHSKNKGATGLVNGILRSISRSADNLPKPDSTDPAQCLSICYSHPLWLVKRFLELLGREETEALLAANNGEPPTTLQVNTYRSDAATLLASLEKNGVSVQPHPWLSNCLTVTGTGDLERLSAFASGECYVQDAAARLAVLAADPKPGACVLDACAAPGGKSFAVAIAMENRGEVVSCDIHPHKIALITAGQERLGLGIISAMVQNGQERRAEWENSFDLVLADVPCSGLGVIRKKPDIRYKDPALLTGLPPVQAAILDNVSFYVKPGGVIVYSTCTLLPEENQQVVIAFLAAHPEFTAEPFRLPDPVGVVPDGMLTLWPHLHDTDGFFIARLRKKV